jgi:hypothetical protein
LIQPRLQGLSLSLSLSLSPFLSLSETWKRNLGNKAGQYR